MGKLEMLKKVCIQAKDEGLTDCEAYVVFVALTIAKTYKDRTETYKTRAKTNAKLDKSQGEADKACAKADKAFTKALHDIKIRYNCEVC